MVTIKLSAEQMINLQMLLNLALEKAAEKGAGLEAAKAVVDLMDCAEQDNPENESNNP